jgi:hypothetical protein
MTERDRETFEAFAARFALIEAIVPDRPRAERVRARGVRWGRLGVAAVGFVAVVLVGGAIGGRLLLGAGLAGASGRPDADASAPPAATAPVAAAAPTSTPVPYAPVLVPLDPPSPVETLPPPCYQHYTTDDRAATSPAQDAASATSVVIARVGAIGAARWNTPDGRPRGRYLSEPSDVMRFVHLDIESTIHGETMPALVTAWVVGGTIGCQEFDVSWLPTITVGAEYVVFLHDVSPKTGQPGVLAAPEVWAIRDGSVATPFSGAVPVNELVAQINADPRSSATP